jgi:hypothetical protein
MTVSIATVLQSRARPNGVQPYACGHAAMYQQIDQYVFNNLSPPPTPPAAQPPSFQNPNFGSKR